MMSADARDVDSKSGRSDEMEIRRQRATAALLALGFYAALGALLVCLRSRWADMARSTRVIFALGILGANYAVALWGTIRRNASVGTLFFFVGSFLYAATLAFLCVDSSADVQEAGSRWGFVESANSVVGYWALGVFALAFVCESFALHIVAIFATLLWLVVDPREIGAPVALIYCALGEHWAWRRKSSCASHTYLATALCVLALSFLMPDLRVGAALLAPLAALGSVVAYWFGVNFRSAPLRGLAILSAACALGVGSFDDYWRATLTFADGTSESAGSLTVKLLADAFSLLFVFYCTNVTLTGARLSFARFIFGAVALVVWGVVVSSRAGAIPVGLALIALSAFAFLFVEFRLRASYGARAKVATPRNQGTTGVDALDDDAEFDDVFDAEARKVRNAPHILATAELLEEIRGKIRRRIGNAPVWGAVFLQFVLALLVARRF